MPSGQFLPLGCLEMPLSCRGAGRGVSLSLQGSLELLQTAWGWALVPEGWELWDGPLGTEQGVEAGATEVGSGGTGSRDILWGRPLGLCWAAPRAAGQALVGIGSPRRGCGQGAPWRHMEARSQGKPALGCIPKLSGGEMGGGGFGRPHGVPGTGSGRKEWG